ncbi:hypothetical protein crov257 [Cafeteria roenbergensis virus]|uniref:Uncharacterized protein n=1 Tax=Cafeteria roenbergensis virus (strain BV-PW1) TaxID=693272 RepID=E3T527_CROVB|nr:hypothetical protein crov257 [Cafeteria roenbergensis virus BV-PW1]ADO67290.1 hypothetical protein crov257 [Cafeteria roenbergensis virus BV-PW1]
MIGINQIYTKIDVNYLLRKETKLLETVIKDTPPKYYLFCIKRCLVVLIILII